MLSLLAPILRTKIALLGEKILQGWGAQGKIQHQEVQREKMNRKGPCGIGWLGPAHSLGEHELSLGSAATLECNRNSSLSCSASVMGAGPLLELLVKAASLLFPHGFHGDFYPSIGVCLSAVPELLTFLFPLIVCLTLNVITLVRYRAPGNSNSLCNLLSRSHFFPDIKWIWSLFDFSSCSCWGTT